MHIQLAEDAPGVGAHRVRRDLQLLSYLPAVLALCHAGEYGPLSRAEYVERIARPGILGVVPQLPQNLAEHFRREPGMARADSPDHGFEVIRALPLEHPGVHAGPDSIERVRDVTIRGDDDHVGRRPSRLELLHYLGRRNI